MQLRDTSREFVVGSHQRTRRTIGAVAVAVALAAACSNGTATSHGAASSTANAAPSPSTGPQITVRMTDFHLALSRESFPPGIYTFLAMNIWQTEHALVIAGPDVAGKRTPVLQPGQSAKLTTTLQPGSYELYCPVDGHKADGMDTYLTVTGTDQTGPH
jgi:hypothetical protein